MANSIMADTSTAESITGIADTIAAQNFLAFTFYLPL
jgi:hypothetical protein